MIYFDYQASTPVDPRVFESMKPHFSAHFGNPHSAHAFGCSAAESVEDAREKIACLIGADSDEIIFTSGATESNNLALFGLAQRRSRGRNKILISSIEHKSIFAVGRELEKKFGVECIYIPVNNEGLVDFDFIYENLDESVLAISIIGVNNEIGTIQPIAKIGRLAYEFGAFFHSDAAQAPCALDIDVYDCKISLMSLSSHKIYGPQGIGALYIKRDFVNKIEPQIFGGGQQNNIRSGTLPVALCVGFGRAAELMKEDFSVTERKELSTLRDLFVYTLTNSKWPIFSNGPKENIRHPGNANLRFSGFAADDILSAIQLKLAASSGSACNFGTTEPSYVLKAIGLTDDEASSSLRFSLGRFTTNGEVDEAIDIINAALLSL